MMTEFQYSTVTVAELPFQGRGPAIQPPCGLGPPRDRDQTLNTPGEVGPGQRWILEAGLRVEGPGTSPILRTREEFCTVRNSAR
jgi:hypothetical protein